VQETSDDQVAAAAVAALQHLQSVDPAAAGIGSEEPRTPVAEVARWSTLVQRGSTELRKAGERLAGPAGSLGATAIVAAGVGSRGLSLRKSTVRQGSVVAILDWENRSRRRATLPG